MKKIQTSASRVIVVIVAKNRNTVTMLYLKIIAVGLCVVFVRDAVEAAEPCSNTTV